jgi:hypothetical protein
MVINKEGSNISLSEGSKLHSPTGYNRNHGKLRIVGNWCGLQQSISRIQFRSLTSMITCSVIKLWVKSQHCVRDIGEMTPIKSLQCVLCSFCPMNTTRKEYPYLSMVLQLFVVPWSLFQFPDLFTQSVEVAGPVIRPSQGRYLHTGQHKHRINVHRHPCLKWDSNPRSQCLRGQRQFMP